MRAGGRSTRVILPRKTRLPSRMGVPRLQEASMSLRWSCLGVVAVLGFSSVAGAQSSDALPTAIAGTMMMFFVFCIIAVYIYMALALQTIANKTATANA